jgi:hypothetical protein
MERYLHRLENQELHRRFHKEGKCCFVEWQPVLDKKTLEFFLEKTEIVAETKLHFEGADYIVTIFKDSRKKSGDQSANNVYERLSYEIVGRVINYRFWTQQGIPVSNVEQVSWNSELEKTAKGYMDDRAHQWLTNKVDPHAEEMFPDDEQTDVLEEKDLIPVEDE